MSFATLAALTIHDVKNRLATLAGRAESRGDTQTLREALDAATQLTSLLACYKAENGWLGANIDVNNPNDLLADLKAEAQRLTQLPIEIENPELQGLFFYDENLVRLVLNNAIHNALRYAKQRILLIASHTDQWLEFTIQDDGPGYPAEQLECSPQPTGLTEQGTGLGLYLANLVAGLHKHQEREGHIQLSNMDGARFTLRLPL